MNTQKNRRELDATVVCIYQTKTSVNGDPTHAWFPRNSRQSLELSGLRDWTCLLGAVTEDGESFFARFPEYVTADHAKQFIQALYQELEDDLIVILDVASYSRASTVMDLAGRDGLAFERLPAYRPDLNPVEECSRQLESALGNRYFAAVNELTLPSAHTTSNSPRESIGSYRNTPSNFVLSARSVCWNEFP